MQRILAVTIAIGLCTSAALAHPHFNKTVTASLPQGVELTITYNTTPANESRAAEAKLGTFVTPRRPILKFSADLKGEKATIAAGEYTLGVIKNGEKDWTLALYPGRLERNAVPDVAKALRLDSVFSTDGGTADHMLIDVTPGHGKFEGKAVLTLHFGTLLLAGVLA